MIRHIVLFRLTATDAADRERDVVEMRRRLEALVGVVPGLRSMQLGADAVGGNHWHAALVSEHDDEAAVRTYLAHPGHTEAAAFISAVTTADRAIVDYELPA